MPDILIPATVIGSWSFPGWYEKFVADVASSPDRFGAADREERRSATRFALAVVDQLVPRASTGLPTARCSASISTSGFTPTSEGLQPLPRTQTPAGDLLAHDQRSKYRLRWADSGGFLGAWGSSASSRRLAAL